MENKLKNFTPVQYCPQCGNDSIKKVNNIHAIWRSLPVYKCEVCSFRFSVRKHETDIDLDLE